jgi:hypothetical protein
MSEAGSDLCWLANGTHKNHDTGMWLPPVKSFRLDMFLYILHRIICFRKLAKKLIIHKSLEYKPVNRSNIYSSQTGKATGNSALFILTL